MLLTNAYDPDPRVRQEALALIGMGCRVKILAWDRDLKSPAIGIDGRRGDRAGVPVVDAWQRHHADLLLRLALPEDVVAGLRTSV